MRKRSEWTREASLYFYKRPKFSIAYELLSPLYNFSFFGEGPLWIKRCSLHDINQILKLTISKCKNITQPHHSFASYKTSYVRNNKCNTTTIFLVIIGQQHACVKSKIFKLLFCIIGLIHGLFFFREVEFREITKYFVIQRLEPGESSFAISSLSWRAHICICIRVHVWINIILPITLDGRTFFAFHPVSNVSKTT